MSDMHGPFQVLNIASGENSRGGTDDSGVLSGGVCSEGTRASAQRSSDIDVPPTPIATVALSTGVPLLPFEQPTSEAAEQYRLIRTNIRLHPAAPKVIAISSPMPGDGKTVTSVNIAAVLALNEGAPVLLIDGDLRKQGVARAIGLKAKYGLSDLINGKCTATEAIVRTDRIPNVHVMSGGALVTNPAELLDSDSFRSVVSTLRAQFGYIIFDTTPIIGVADFRLVQQVSDGFVLVVRPDFTNRSEFHKALEVESRSKLLGIVINAFPNWFLYRRAGGHYYRRAGAQTTVR